MPLPAHGEAALFCFLICHCRFDELELIHNGLFFEGSVNLSLLQELITERTENTEYRIDEQKNIR